MMKERHGGHVLYAKNPYVSTIYTILASGEEVFTGITLKLFLFVRRICPKREKLRNNHEYRS